MTKERTDQRDFEYDLNETIAELDGWLNHGKRFYPIETAMSAEHWLSKFPGSPLGEHPISFEDTSACLRAWLTDDTPHLPESTGEAALYWLLRVAEQSPPKRIARGRR